MLSVLIFSSLKIEQMGVFNTEIIMMTTTLKEMEKILDDDTKFCAKCLYGQDNPPAIIIEDLTELGFRLADRQTGLDLQHSLLAIKNLAKFHASSVAVVEKASLFFHNYMLDMFCINFFLFFYRIQVVKNNMIRDYFSLPMI